MTCIPAKKTRHLVKRQRVDECKRRAAANRAEVERACNAMAAVVKAMAPEVKDEDE